MKAKCPHCSKSFSLKPEFYGKKVKCGCGQTMTIPKAPASTQASTARQARATSEPIRFQCSTCFKSLKVPASAGGKLAKCTCGAKNQVPHPSHQKVAVASMASQQPPSYDPFADDLFSQPASHDAYGGSMALQNSGLYSGQVVSKPSYLSGPAKTKAKAKRKVIKKKAKSVSTFDWWSLAQIAGGVVVLLVAMGLVMAAMNADRVRGRAFKGIFFLGAFGVGLICKGIIAAIQSI